MLEKILCSISNLSYSIYESYILTQTYKVFKNFWNIQNIWVIMSEKFFLPFQTSINIWLSSHDNDFNKNKNESKFY